ncbi:MAG: HEAT repeat domain-containing protein [Planctomycetaceae bacterium]
MTGGKGEPGAVVAAKREPTPLDELLKTLQNPGALNLEEAQADLVEQVQFGDRSELIGQKDLLVRLVKHPHGDVRRAATFALGRTNDLSLARLLIEALEDKDLGVAMEAHAALSWLSRRFDGFGIPINPLDEVPDGAADNEKQSIIEGWRDRARREWGTWYLKVRPYSERGDEFEATLRQRLGDQK